MDQLFITCKCGQKMKVADSALGKTGTCVGCGKRLKITKRNTEIAQPSPSPSPGSTPTSTTEPARTPIPCFTRTLTPKPRPTPTPTRGPEAPTIPTGTRGVSGARREVRGRAMKNERVNTAASERGEKWVFFLVFNAKYVRVKPHDTQKWTELEVSIMRAMQDSWTEDDLSSFRFRAVPVPEDWDNESTGYVVRTLVNHNLPSDFEEGRDWTWGRLVISQALGLEYWYILVRRPLLRPVRLEFIR